MKIAKVEVIPVSVPLRKAAESAHGRTTHQESVVIKVHTANGAYGIGAIEPRAGYDVESHEEVAATVKEWLAPSIIGEDPFRIKWILGVMDREIPGHWGSKALVEMALFDLLGRSLGVPVHVFFGGQVREEILLNGWIGLLEPDKARQEAVELLDKGFRSLKVKMNSEITAAKERVEAVRSAVKNEFQIRVDANESLDMERAQEAVQALQDLDVFYLEQPFHRESIQNLVALCRSSPIRLMADESVHDMETLLSILRSNAAHFVKLKVQKMGGLLKTSQAIQVAESFGIPVILGHGFGMTISTLAEFHLAASTRAVLDGCESVGPMKMADDVVREPLDMARGYMRVPTKPGLGAELDEEKLKKYRIG